MGTAAEQQLSGGGSDGGARFERAHVDTFTLNTKDLGDLQSIQIRLVSTNRPLYPDM